MSEEKDAEDGSDWLSSQFAATAAVPAQPNAAALPAAAAPPVAPPAVRPVAPPVAPQIVTPLVLAPTQNAGGGFNWGLKPGGVVEQLPAAPPPATAPLTPPAVAVAAPPIPATPFPAPPFPSVPLPSVPAPPPAPAPASVQPAPIIPPALVDPPTEPYVAPPPQPYLPEPTKPLSWDEFASTQQQSTPAALPPVPLDQPTEAYTVQPWQPAAAPSVPEQYPVELAAPPSAIDSLFGDHKFQDYEEVGVLKTIQVPPAAAVDDSPLLREPREPLPRSQKVLLGVAGGLFAALLLVGLYFFGQHLGAAAAVQPTTASTGASSVTPTPAGSGGPAASGVQQWTALQGGECIQPFSSAWALTLTVVACTADHDAEMVFKGKLPDDSSSKYPTAADFQTEITPLCRASTAINYGAAVSVTDLQVSFSYPPNTASWLSGDRTYYCFVDRVSGGNLPGDLAVPKTP